MGPRLWIAATGLALAAAAPPQDHVSRTGSLTDDEKILHVLSRFSPGPTAAMVEEVRKEGWRAWFERQLKGDAPEPDALTSRTAKFESLALSTAEILEKFEEKPGKDATRAEKRESRRLAMTPPQEALSWVLFRAVYGANPIRETSCDFFRNHFSVSIEKGEVRFLIVDWERSVIHEHALGRFGDMLEASAKNPAMLFYLDNALSRRTPTEQELQRMKSRDAAKGDAVDLARQRGLNENYARELMELHTLGADNFYKQEDVVNVALCLTGWTIKRRAQTRGSFDFNPRMHAPGDKTVLGHTIKADEKDPIQEGEAVLDLLKHHEGTAAFLSKKLCRWFVNDDPDPEMVARVSKVFRETDGDLPKVFTAIVEDPAFFDRKNYRAKFKRPWEFVVSALRLTGAELSFPPMGVNQALVEMNEPIYRCADPTGFYDQAEAWCDPGAMAARWTFAADLVAGRVPGVKIPSTFFDDLPRDKPREWKEILARKLLPVCGLGTATSASIDRLVEAELAKDSKPAPKTLGAKIAAAILGSPEFQKQ